MTKFTHIRDPRDQRRVLTLARTLTKEGDSDVVNVGFAVNFVRSEAHPDTYNRKLGNKIAIGRLEKQPIRIELHGRHPMDAIRGFFTSLDHDVLEAIQIPYRVKQIVELNSKRRVSAALPQTV